MSGEKGQTYATGLLQAIFTATFSGSAITSLLANASSPLTSLYVSLHTADPTATGSQSTNEVSYTGYARVAVARTTGGFTVGTATVSPAATISFGACTAGTATATNWAIGTASSGAGNILYTGPISPSISISSGVTPQLTTASTVTEA
jgi:hypothetical protein